MRKSVREKSKARQRTDSQRPTVTEIERQKMTEVLTQIVRREVFLSGYKSLHVGTKVTAERDQSG